MDVFDKVVPDVNPRQWPKSLVKQWKHTCILGLLVGNAADCRSEHRPACSIDNRDLLPCSHAPMLRTSLRQGLGSLRLSGATPRQDLKINTPGGNVR
jgi:hypothetical protein